MTKQEFIQHICNLRRIYTPTLVFIQTENGVEFPDGRIEEALPCDCGTKICKGWVMRRNFDSDCY